MGNFGRAVPEALTAIVTAVVSYLLLRASLLGSPVTAKDGTRVFRYSTLARRLAAVYGIAMTILVTALLFVIPIKPGDALNILLLYGLLAGIPLYGWWLMSRFELVATVDGLECKALWKSRQFFAWPEVEELTYNLFFRRFVLHAWGRRKFRVSLLVAGIDEFLEICEKHLPKSALARAKYGYNEVGRSFPVG